MTKRAIVLSGGGARGGYHIGVWQALRELGIDYQMVTGTSVGALNGAIMAQNDFEAARDMWERLRTSDVVDTEIDVTSGGKDEQREAFMRFIMESFKKGGADFSPLAGTIASIVDEEKCRSSDIDFGLVTVKYPSLRPVVLWKDEIPEGRLYDYMLASAACFPAFRTQEIDGEKFIDGGYYDGMPINMALERGANEVIAVVLDGIGINRKPALKPGQTVTYIASHWDLGNILVFDGERAKRIMRLGYLDAMRRFGKYEGCAYTLEIGELAKNTITLSGAATELADKLVPDTLKLTPTVLSAGRRLVELLKEYGSVGAGSVSLKRMMSDHRLLVSLALPMMMEVCAEMFEVDYLQIYHFIRLDREIYERYMKEKAEFESVAQQGETESNAGRLTELVSQLRSLGKRAAVYYIKRMLEQAADGKTRSDMLPAAALLPKEFWAAVYLCVLERTAGFLFEGMSGSNG